MLRGAMAFALAAVLNCIVLTLLVLQIGIRLRADRIAFTSNRSGNYDIFVTDIGRGLLVNLSHSHLDEFNPTWSPDGEHLAYITSMRVGGSATVYILDVEHRRVSRLAHESSPEGFLIWSPDSTQFAFHAAQGGRIAVVDVADEQVTVNFSNSSGALGAWSPDGRQLAFVANAGGYADIYLLDVTNNEARNLTLTSWWNDYAPLWSPDGERLVFISDRSLTSELYMMHLGSRETVYLGKSDNILDWSPDGQQVLFQSTQSGDWEIYVLDVFSRNARNVSRHPAHDLAGVWSPDGEQLAFISSRDGNWEVYVIDLETGALTNVSSSPAVDGSPAWWP